MRLDAGIRLALAAALAAGCAATPLKALSPLDAGPDPFADIGVYDRADWSRAVTACDRLAGHPDDPEHVAAGGRGPGEIDLPAAIAACREAVAEDPDNPRLNYQLGRVYGYSGDHAQGDPYRAVALRAGYPQALFVYGYIRLDDWDGRGADPCYGGELIRRSAEAGRFAGLVGFVHYALEGRFQDCPRYPRVEPSELRAFLKRAEASADGYYQRLLVEALEGRLDEAFGPTSGP